MRYGTPEAFRAALDQRLKNDATAAGVALMRLRKRVAFERFLARLLAADAQGWVFTGAFALDLRLGLGTRTTKDIDLVRTDDEQVATEHLVAASAIDLGDFLDFDVRRTGGLDAAAGFRAVRYSIWADLAGGRFETWTTEPKGQRFGIVGTSLGATGAQESGRVPSMGMLGRLLDKLSGRGSSLQGVDVPIAGGYWRGASTLAEGERLSGRIVGIRRKLEDGTDSELLALEVRSGTATAVSGVRIRADRMERLRLGLAVPVRAGASGRVVVDWPAMCVAWGLSASEPAQKPLRRAPDHGVTDTALDARVQRRLKRGEPGRATIASLERRTAFGMPTENWNVGLRLADGRAVRADGDVIPFYAAWLAAPGAEVPVALDASNPDRVTVDWPAAANEALDRAGALADRPPSGSVAGLIEHARAVVD